MIYKFRHRRVASNRRRFSYANVTATVALVLSMGGAAVAAKHYLITSTSEISPGVLKALKGKTGPPGPRGKPGINGTNGVNGANGKDGTALAYAHVQFDGTVLNSFNIPASGVTSTGAGVFCIRGLSFTPNNVVATADLASDSVGDVAIAELGAGSGCPAQTQITVKTSHAGATTTSDISFFVNVN